jgi:uncharacterized protein (DUF1697 family)
MTEYALFLRGINVGGNRKVTMADLRAYLKGLGFENVRTLLTSGNVLFTGTAEDPTATLAAGLAERFGFKIGTLLRKQEEIMTMVRDDPFADVNMTPATRAYVSFLAKPPVDERPGVINAHFQILQVTTATVYSVVELTPDWGTTESMAVLEKRFGTDITTRNWNTVHKLALM